MRDPRFLSVALVVLVVSAALVGWYLGGLATLAELNENADSAYSLKREADELKTALTQSESELEMLRTRYEVDRQALEMVRSEIAGHEEREAELEEVLRFYQALMAPADEVEGLGLRAPEVVAREKPGHYRYRVVVQQEARRHEVVTGSMGLEIVGELKGFEISYPLKEVATAFSEDATVLNFRYFQTFEGEIVVPQEFQPSEIIVNISAVKPRKVDLSERYPWQLQERFTYVGK